MCQHVNLLLSATFVAAFPLYAELAPAYIPAETLYQGSDVVAMGRCEAVRSSTGADSSVTNYEELFSLQRSYKPKNGGILVP